MGNIKYPLNGRHLTLGDLVTEFGYIGEELKMDASIITDVATYLKDITPWKNSYGSEQILVEKSDGLSEIKDISSIDSNSNVWTTKINEWYENFSNHIYGGIGSDTFAHSPYDICYFPTVISDKERTPDNKSFKTIQVGDDASYSPDRYVKYKDVIIANGDSSILMYRIMPLFHYVYIDNNNNAKDNAKTFRFSFNYKLNNGLATSIYMLKQMYDIQLDSSTVKVKLQGNYVSKSADGNIDTLSFSSLQDSSAKKLIDILLFGDNKDSINILNDFDSPNTEYEANYCLLYDIADQRDNIRNSNTYEISTTAYKILQNYELRGGINHNDMYTLSDNYIISHPKYDPSSNIQDLTWNDILKYVITGETRTGINEGDTIISYDISSHDDIIQKTYYEFDSQNNQNLELYDAHKKINLYYKLLYYSTILVNCQLYHTGIIVHAVYDVINPLHKYTTEDPLYRCDVGANTDIISVEYVRALSIITEYGLTARSIPDTDIISVIIPLNIETKISHDNLMEVRYTWTISEIKKLLRNGVSMYAQLRDDTAEGDDVKYKSLDIDVLASIKSNYDYMILSQDGKSLYMSDQNISTITDNINTTLFTQNASTYIYGNKPVAHIDYERSAEINNVDTSLNVYSAISNPAVNTSDTTNQPDTNNMTGVSQFFGTLYARLTYNNKTFTVNIPIMRLQNYYYEQDKGNNKYIYLFFEDITKSIQNMTNISQYPVVRYSIPASNIREIHLLTGSPLYMAYHMQQGKYTKYISGAEKTLSAGQNGSYYKAKIEINGEEVERHVLSCYIISEDSKNDDEEYDIVINKDNVQDKTTINIDIHNDSTTSIDILNKSSHEISCLYQAASSATTENNSETYTVNYSNNIKIDNEGYVYYSANDSESNTNRYIYIYYDKTEGKMVPTDDKTYYMCSLGGKTPNVVNSTSISVSSATQRVIIYNERIVIYKINNSLYNATFTYKDNISVIPEAYITDNKVLYTITDFTGDNIDKIKKYIKTDGDQEYNIATSESTDETTNITTIIITITEYTSTPSGGGDDPEPGPVEDPDPITPPDPTHGGDETE